MSVFEFKASKIISIDIHVNGFIASIPATDHQSAAPSGITKIGEEYVEKNLRNIRSQERINDVSSRTGFENVHGSNILYSVMPFFATLADNFRHLQQRKPLT